MELALENYDARTKYKPNFLGNLRLSGEAVSCLLEIPKHVAFLYMKPGCLELWSPRVTNQNALPTVRSIKRLKLKKKRAYEHLVFLENEHLSKAVLSLRAPRKFLREHSRNGLTLRAFRRLEGPFATPNPIRPWGRGRKVPALISTFENFLAT